jgi:hypothetical protein
MEAIPNEVVQALHIEVKQLREELERKEQIQQCLLEMLTEARSKKNVAA